MRNPLLYILILTSFTAFGQGDSFFDKSELEIKPILNLQLWSTYTHQAKVFNPDLDSYQAVDDRFNTQLRRSRIGIKGKLNKWLSFNLTSAYDLVGRDALSGTAGGTNNGGSPSIRLWNAFAQFRLSQKSDLLHLTVGYQVPQIGRESITSGFRVPGLEKAWSQNYLRRHIVGTGPGRAMGVNLGGQLIDTTSVFNFGYEIGIFSTTFQGFGGNSTGTQSSPLLSGRLIVYLGDPEFNSYKLGRKQNYFSDRKGLSLALSGTYQGETDLFTENYALGADFLLSWKNWNIDGEWSLLWRRFANDQVDFKIRSQTGHLRLSYNYWIRPDILVEPNIMLVQFNGPTSAREQSEASYLGSLSGKDEHFVIGLSVHPHSQVIVSMSYNFRQGNRGSMPEGSTVNNFFYQAEVGPIQRGNWFGLGVIFIL